MKKGKSHFKEKVSSQRKNKDNDKKGGNGKYNVMEISTTPNAIVLAQKQREISISEFFAKNRHLLGFDNPKKALLTAVKEAVDNALDACEEAKILPEIHITIDKLAEDRFKICVQDNGPGIVKNQVGKIFGKLLYGSKFHRLKMSRGQQGLGISAAVMYGQLTTAKPTIITTKISPNKPAFHFQIQIDTAKNTPEVISEEEIPWEIPHGTKVEIELIAKYQKGNRSVDDYIFQTALANPHATIIYKTPDGENIIYERSTTELPQEPKEVKPHPYGVELGFFSKMLKETKARTISSFLSGEFSRVSPRIANEILQKANVDPITKPSKLTNGDAQAIYHAISQVKIIAPPTDCIVPIGEELIKKSLQKLVKADFYETCSRKPAVYRGNPFLVECGIAYGGNLPPDEQVQLYRFANRVPLLYQQSACVINKALITTTWRNYKLQQPKNSIPTGPAVIFVHIASVWVPFTSESKEAIAHYPEILHEVKLALQECGRKLALYLSRKHRAELSEKRYHYLEKYVPHISESLKEILSLNKKMESKIYNNLIKILKKTRFEFEQTT